MATISVSFDPVVWRAQLAVTVNASASYVEVQRTEDQGFSTLSVRGTYPADPTLSTMLGGTSRTIYDSEFPLDQNVQYRCRGRNPATGYTEAWSAWTDPAHMDSVGCTYVIHPVSYPADVWAGDASEEPGYTRDAPRGVFNRLGLDSPVVVMGRRHTPLSSTGLTLLARSHAERTAIEAVVGQDQIMCVRGPAANGWAHRYVVFGDLTVTHRRPVQSGAWLIKCPWVEVDSSAAVPVVSFGPTWQGVIDNYLTWTRVINDNATWNVLVGRVF